MKNSEYNVYLTFENDKIIFNTRTTNIIELEENKFNSMQNCDFYCLDSEEMEFLVTNGFVVDENTNELEEIESEYFKSTNNSNVLHLTIMTTLNCNFRCFYCFEHRKNDSNAKLSNIDNIKNIVETYVSQIDRLHVDWYGGEPLLNIPYIEHLSNMLMDLCNKHNIEYDASITTNGYLLNKKCAQKLSKLKVNRAQITIDGNEEIHNQRRILSDGSGTYKDILNNLVETKDIIQSSIRCNIDATNMNYIKQMIDDLCSCGLSETCIAFKGIVTSDENDVSDIQMNGKILSDVLYQLNEYAADKGMPLAIFSNIEYNAKCFCIVDTDKQFILTPDMKVYKCGESYLDNEIGYVGDLCRESITDIYINTRKTVWVKSQFDEKCKNCIILPMCYGGCSMKRNKFDNPCNEDLKYNLERYIKLYLKFLKNRDDYYESF